MNNAPAGNGPADATNETEFAETEASAGSEQDAESDHAPSDWNFMDVVNMLEDLGLYDAMGGSDFQSMTGINPADGDPLPAIKALIAGLQEKQIVPSAQLKMGLERLQLYITAVLEGKTAATINGQSLQDLRPNQMADLAQLNKWLKGILAEVPDQKNDSGLSSTQSALAARPSVIISSETGTAAETTVQTPDVRGGKSEPGASSYAGDAGQRKQSEDVSEGDPAKPPAGSRTPSPGTNMQQSLKAANVVENPEADTPEGKKSPLTFSNERMLNRGDTADKPSPVPEHDRLQVAGQVKEGQLQKADRSPGMSSIVTKDAETPNEGAADDKPVSKVFQETQLTKRGVVTAESASTEETVTKVIKIESGNTENSLMNASGPGANKAPEAASLTKETEAGQNEMRNPAMDQIIRKAAIHLRNGQHEARIELKPDFLGHIRLQVISENHQVTVKILAEHGFVKDMIENNVHQLKADLQQQGLEVDKLEVTVSRDQEESGNPRENLAQSKDKRTGGRHGKAGRFPDEAQQKDNRKLSGNYNGNATVDYFA
jgi:flagellar hook-length control protein FliK